MKAITCPNCRSSRIRRSKRNPGEKFFLPVVLRRPFRCEDCVDRFYGWIWSAPSALPEREPDGNVHSVGTSSFALRSGFHRSRAWRRKFANTLGLSRAQQLFPVAVRSWLNKPMQRLVPQPAMPATMLQAAIQTPVDPAVPAASGTLDKGKFMPEVLGVILEIKHEDTLTKPVV